MNKNTLIPKLLFAPLLLSSGSALANTETVHQYMERYDGVITFIIAVATVIGLSLVINGILHFKNTARDSMRYPFAEGIKKLAVGVSLIALPFIYVVMINSFFVSDASWSTDGSNSVLMISNNISEINEGTGNVFNDYIPPRFQAIGLFFLNAIGLIFIIRGIMMFTGEAGKGSTTKDAMYAIVSGIMLMNPQFIYGAYMWLIGPIQ